MSATERFTSDRRSRVGFRRLLNTLLKAPVPSTGFDQDAAESLLRTEEWLADRGVARGGDLPARLDEAFAWPRAVKSALPLDPEVLHAAAALGEYVRRVFGGRWVAAEETFYAEPHVAEFGGLSAGKFFPLPLLEAAWLARQGNFLESFCGALPARLSAERERLERAGSLEAPWKDHGGAEGPVALSVASESAQAFRLWMDQSTGAGKIPLSLVGVREIDRFLRSHYCVNCLEEDALVGAGFFLGETARGLFGGTWSLKETPPWDRAALVWPELPYYPVGRVFKMLTQRPLGDPLDEYIRIIPSARKALQAEQSAPTDR